MWLFKAVGMVLVFSACTGFGFFKAYSLGKRRAMLKELYRGMSVLKENIRMGRGEAEALINTAFDSDTVCFKNNDLITDFSCLQREEKELLSDYFENFGMSDILGECERTELYMNMLSVRLAEAEEKFKELFKLYTAVGALGGLFICIFFM